MTTHRKQSSIAFDLAAECRVWAFALLEPKILGSVGYSVGFSLKPMAF
jgi:hypothetical protein